MKKWYAAIIIAFLLPIYALFFYSAFDTDATVSDDEQRELATMPALSLRSVLSGDFGAGFETYYADTFPFREKLLQIRVLHPQQLFPAGPGRTHIHQAAQKPPLLVRVLRDRPIAVFGPLT